MNIEQLAKDFWKNGYLVIEDFFKEELMDYLNKLILDNFGMNPEFWHNDEFLSKSQTEVIPWFPQREGITDFDEVENDGRLKSITQKILGEGWLPQYCMVMFSKKGTVGQAWHQDCPPDDQAKFNMNRLVYTMDITDEVGGQTVVVPKTHTLGELSAGDPHVDLENQIVLNPKKGTLVLLHGHTWHRVLPIKGTYRVSTNYRTGPAGTPEDITDICVYRNMRYRFSTSEVLEERS